MNALRRNAADLSPVDSGPARRARSRRAGIGPLSRLCCVVVLLGAGLDWANAEPPGADATAPPATADRQLLAERARLARENDTLRERLRALEGQHALARKLEAQATRLAGLAERLETRLAEAEAAAGAGDSIGAQDRRVAVAEDRLAQARTRAERLEARVAELEARLKQQQLTVEEALLRADKAEKLHAALEEAHARVSTENERLSLELAIAKKRQAAAVQRVVELDTRLEAKVARAAAAIAPVSDPPEAAAPDDDGYAATAVQVGTKVVYEVREEDTLSRIAAKVYGDANAWQRIFDANRDVLDGPDDLALGMRLIIP
jgi:nucleoid-associated protein YgaU